MPGISSFDLLGNYSRLEWLSNFYLVLGYNMVFAVATGVCLVTKFTFAIRQELYRRLATFRQTIVCLGFRNNKKNSLTDLFL